MRTLGCLLVICAVSILSAASSVEPATPLQWQTVTLTFDGPQTSETATPNPFTDYRMSVTFSKDGEKGLTAQGFFAADGDAGNSSAVAGNKWRVRFTPPEPGRWTWTASFRTGTGVAYSADPAAGSATAFDGESGAFVVHPAPANARGFQKKGYLRYVHGHYLQFQNGDYFLKGGAGSPENFLGYFEFDGTFDTGAHGQIATDAGAFLHHYAPHAGDWHEGDPTWQGGKGKNIIGALNYLASKGVDSLYFLTYNIDGGDGKDTWVWTSPEVRDRFDVSKLDQWEIVFSHMERLGILMHLFIQETENDHALGGDAKLNRIRQLYLRELVARFGHHLAIVWNLGEENNTPRLDRFEISRYITSLEPVPHPITVHTHNTRSRRGYTGIIGTPEFQAASIQGRMEDANAEAISLRARSAWSGQPWAIFHDEQAPSSVGAMPDKDDPAHDTPRKQELWGNLMGGGAGVDWYFGYNYPNTDLNAEDFRSRDILWDQTRYALEFFQKCLPFHEMWPANDLSTTPGTYVFTKEGEIYVVYSPESDATQITLASGQYSLQWYNPRTGGALVEGATPTLTVKDGSMHDEGAVTITPPYDRGKDWVALIKRISQ
jgi:Domain of unknown function (DUF5060)/Putative collagen-binding domain of a collagenase